MKLKKATKALVAVAAAVGLAFTVQSFTSPEPAAKPKADTTKFVKTKNGCSKCGCKGYWGYKHLNNTYEGNCSNSDGNGYTCNHGPEKHGLRKW